MATQRPTQEARAPMGKMLPPGASKAPCWAGAKPRARPFTSGNTFHPKLQNYNLRAHIFQTKKSEQKSNQNIFSP